jgi:hypothetical protein
MPRYAIVSLDAGPTAGDEGRPVFWKYNGTVSYFAGTNHNFAGYVHRVQGNDISAGQVEIELQGDRGPNLFSVSVAYSGPASQLVYIAERACRVIDISGRPTTAAAFTAGFNKVPVNTTIANGTTLLAANTTYNFNGTANANQLGIALSTNTSVLSLAAGDAIALVPNATATGAIGIITILLAPTGK